MQKNSKKLSVASEPVRLGPFVPELAAQLVLWAEHEDFKEFFRHSPPVIEWASPGGIASLFGHGFFVFQGTTLVGYVNVTATTRGSAEFGLLLDRRFIEGSRRELTVQVIERVAHYAFEEKGLRRLSCRLVAHNEEWANDLRQLGFKLEGRFKESTPSGQDEIFLTRMAN